LYLKRAFNDLSVRSRQDALPRWRTLVVTFEGALPEAEEVVNTQAKRVIDAGHFLRDLSVLVRSGQTDEVVSM
jgi:hypothetical protein